MMHLMATNLCVLLVTAITETAEDYRQQDYIKQNISKVFTCFQNVITKTPFDIVRILTFNVLGLWCNMDSHAKITSAFTEMMHNRLWISTEQCSWYINKAIANISTVV